MFVFQKSDVLKCELIVAHVRGRSSAAHAVSLADVAQLAQAVQVVEPSVVVKVSAVFVAAAEPVTGPAVGLTGFPAPADTDPRTRVNPTLPANDSDLFPLQELACKPQTNMADVGAQTRGPVRPIGSSPSKLTEQPKYLSRFSSV